MMPVPSGGVTVGAVLVTAPRAETGALRRGLLSAHSTSVKAEQRRLRERMLGHGMGNAETGRDSPGN